MNLNIPLNEINNKIQKNIKNLRHNPYLIESKIPLKISDFLITTPNTNILFKKNDSSYQEQEISQIKLSKESPPNLYTEKEDEPLEKYLSYIFIPVLFNIAGQQYSTTFLKDL